MFPRFPHSFWSSNIRALTLGLRRNWSCIQHLNFTAHAEDASGVNFWKCRVFSTFSWERVLDFSVFPLKGKTVLETLTCNKWGTLSVAKVVYMERTKLKYMTNAFKNAAMVYLKAWVKETAKKVITGMFLDCTFVRKGHYRVDSTGNSALISKSLINEFL